MTFGGIQPLVTTFGGRSPRMEDDLGWRTTFSGRQPLVEDNLRKRQPLVEDDLWRKTTLGGRRPLVEDTLWWKTTFGGRRPLVEEDLKWKTTFERIPLWQKTTFHRIYFSHTSMKKGLARIISITDSSHLTPGPDLRASLIEWMLCLSLYSM